MEYRKTLDAVLTGIYSLSEELKGDLQELTRDQDLLFNILDPLQRLDMLLEFAGILAPKIKEEINTSSIHNAITEISSCADEEWEYERYGAIGAEGSYSLTDAVATLLRAIDYQSPQTELFDAIYAEDEFDPKDSGRCEFYMQMLDIC